MKKVDRAYMVKGTKFLLVIKHKNEVFVCDVVSEGMREFYYRNSGDGRLYVLNFATSEVLPVPDLMVIPLDYMDWYVKQGTISDEEVFLSKLSGDWRDVVDKITGRNL